MVAQEPEAPGGGSAEVWDLWIQGAGSQGASFARGRMAPADRVLVHAAPDVLSVDVWTDAGHLVARARDLHRSAATPIALLRREGGAITRDDIWPEESHVGLPVILMGGEVGILRGWWNAADLSEWRWSIGLYNHR